MILRSLLFFIIAGLLEIGGGYLVWLALREGRTLWLVALGGLALAGYGVLATLQPADFGRVYAAYGGVFIVMALLWGWALDGQRPDRWDLLGATLCILGVVTIMFARRTHT